MIAALFLVGLSLLVGTSAKEVSNASLVSRLNAENFYDEVLHRPQHQLILFYFKKGLVCGQLSRYLDVLSQRYPDVRFGTISCASTNRNICRENDVLHYPTLKYFVPNAQHAEDGELLKMEYTKSNIEGYVVRRLVERMLGSPPITRSTNMDVVYQVDLERALRESLHYADRLPTKYSVLINYVKVLKKYFPTGVGGKKFFSCLLKDLKESNGMYPDILSYCEQAHPEVYRSPDSPWVGCLGSAPEHRGYPCGLWTLFHTLTVQAWNQNATDPQEVLSAIVDYTRNYYPLDAQFFLSLAPDMIKQVSTNENSVLWLWNAHNILNIEIAGLASEDPEFPKLPFPPQLFPYGTLTQILKFLRAMYTNIDRSVPNYKL